MQSAKPHFTLTSETQQQFIHYFRHILREITYLPDSTARRVLHQQIVHRFRAYHPKKQSTPGQAPWQAPRKTVRDEDHLNKLLQDCRDRLAWQYRAANGDWKALKKAVFLGYGRIGPRKHKLLDLHSTPDVSEVINDSEKSLKLPLSEALKAIAKEQGRQSSAFMSRLEINTRRYMGDILPEENIWGRPMPINRLVNAKRRKLNELKTKLYPPIPDDEFKQLQGLAAGVIAPPPIPTRRTRLKGLPALPGTTIYQKIKPRTMRRLWTLTLNFCSTIKKNDTTGRYKVSWGKGKYLPLRTPIPSIPKINLFAQTIEPL